MRVCVVGADSISARKLATPCNDCICTNAAQTILADTRIVFGYPRLRGTAGGYGIRPYGLASLRLRADMESAPTISDL